jgi:hypothetical protein
MFFKRMKEDLQNELTIPLVDVHGEVQPSVLHLILFGKASPYLHNGTMPVADENGEVGFKSESNSNDGLNVLENSVFCVKFQMSAQKFNMCDC